MTSWRDVTNYCPLCPEKDGEIARLQEDIRLMAAPHESVGHIVLSYRAEIARLREEKEYLREGLIQMKEAQVEWLEERDQLRDAAAILERSLADQVREVERLREAIEEMAANFPEGAPAWVVAKLLEIAREGK